jgi:nucleoside-diphosphate-sugar epimerase
MRILVVGGTGVISRELVRQMLSAGHEVTIVNRGQRKVEFGGEVEWIRHDKNDHEGFARIFEKRQFDAVVDMICFDQTDAKRTIAVFRDRSDHLVICSSIAAYRRPYRSVPVREEREELWDDPEFTYAYRKAQMERYLQGVVRSESLPITVVRPSLTFGDGARNVGVLRQNMGIVRRISDGKPLVMSGDGTHPWSYTFTPDLARGIIGLLGKSGAFGEAYHITSEEPTLWRDLYLEFGRAVGRTPELVSIPATSLFEALPDLCNHLHYEKRYPGLFDNSRLRDVVPGFRAEISLRRGVELLLESWIRDGLTPDPAKDALEDRLVEAAGRSKAAVVKAASQ